MCARVQPQAPASNAVFIRAPAIVKVGAGVRVLAKVKSRPSVAALAVLKASAAAAVATAAAPPPPPLVLEATPAGDGGFVNDFKRHAPRFAHLCFFVCIF
jgi:hypothetical protein